MAILNNSNAISAGGYDINNSLRFRRSATAYLSRTPASAGTQTTWTWSGWVKRSIFGSQQKILTAGSTGSLFASFEFIAGDNFQFYAYNGATNAYLVTTQVFRDPSAWYHIVFAVDTTQATASNRIKIYVNGTQVTAFSTATYPSQNFTFPINNNVIHNIGRDNVNAGDYFDGYLADVNFIDGSQKAASDFGETDTTTGVWKPKAYTSTYGTNGFYLKFSDIATTSGSNAGLGKDFSGNTNYWTTNNISVTAGTTYDAMIDSPTLTSATVANYAVLNPLLRLNGIVGTFTNGNLNFLAPTAADYYYCSTMFTGTTGKYYSEATINTVGSGILIGLINEAQVGTAWGNKSAYRETGAIYDLSGTAVTSGSTYTTGDVIGIAVDIGAGTVQFYKNNVAQGATPSFSFTAGTPLAFAGRSNNGNADLAFNFGQRPFKYTPPTGYVALNTYNLPDSTVKKGNNSFGVLTYTGNGSTSVTRSDTSLVNFTPDFVWIKERSGTAYHNLFDINRVVSGDYKRIYSNDTTAEESSTYLGTTNLNSFVNGGFTTGSGTNTNNNGSTYVAWCWDANGSPVSNTSGSITSTVSVNTTAGFSVVTYTGTGANATVGHGLGVAPKMIIVKSRSTAGTDWPVYHASLGATGIVALDTTIAFTVISTPWNNTAPTSSVFTVGTSGDTNLNTRTYVAYCWAEIAGYSKAFSYTGNGSTDGSFVFCGFRPKFVLLKSSSTADDWYIHDSTRNTYNVVDLRLSPNLSSAEVQSAVTVLDFLSNGFKLRTSNGGWNGSGNTYIGIAFAENPFKNALAR